MGEFGLGELTGLRLDARALDTEAVSSQARVGQQAHVRTVTVIDVCTPRRRRRRSRCRGRRTSLRADFSPLTGARVVVVGDSSGAGLAAGLLLRLRDAGDPSPVAWVLYSGVYDLPPENGELGRERRNRRDSHGCPRTGDRPRLPRRTHSGGPRGLTALAKLTGLPPLFVLVSGSELLRDDSFLLATRAGSSGGETTAEIWLDIHHAWPSTGASCRRLWRQSTGSPTSSNAWRRPRGRRPRPAILAHLRL
ncbi:alpha/beta hydrolase fold domain-containing protein [Streptomyces sp. NBC_00063]|uniref:alpha/beta hydrolase fold domain-containing protein n=1 Tax=Streptomyces sp. NBC_00063 TaxID=2975638 RepID=UPI003D758C71